MNVPHRKEPKKPRKEKLTSAGSVVCLWCRDGDAQGQVPHHDCPFDNGKERPLRAKPSSNSTRPCRACEGDGFLALDSDTPRNERLTRDSRVCTYCDGTGVSRERALEPAPQQRMTPKSTTAPPVQAAINLKACKTCAALRGDPCRTPSNATRAPHKGRT